MDKPIKLNPIMTPKRINKAIQDNPKLCDYWSNNLEREIIMARRYSKPSLTLLMMRRRMSDDG